LERGELPPDILHTIKELRSALISEPVVSYPENYWPCALIVDKKRGGGKEPIYGKQMTIEILMLFCMPLELLISMRKFTLFTDHCLLEKLKTISRENIKQVRTCLD
jgi:hypothetical protein